MYEWMNEWIKFYVHWHTHFSVYDEKMPVKLGNWMLK